ncbi:MAG: DNA alkylation repair protein [Halobacteriovoraceae bacterium]|jgi:3-methyladenine DNA glycosylase AlkC|nr:DNA alkylation repair protein [Halobacteriovoraceae bacterium]MBT5094994.1 DNA alkylation repair protein [Halobacteriovoraceae bacterium]
MAELLKEAYNKAYISRLARDLVRVYPKFSSSAFSKSVFNGEWDALELKGRMRHITESLRAHLPEKYSEALGLLLKVAPEYGGFEGMFFPDFVEVYGMADKDWKRSIDALEKLTCYSSSEFAVRPFIISDSKMMMAKMLEWSKSKNEHHRRLASEGCRPRLPWACALPEFKLDPTAILPILENLKGDSSLYVRRSVANNLNDIAKDNPEVTLALGKKWYGKNADTDWLVKHAHRTLLKAGHPKALSLFGLKTPVGLKTSRIAVDKSTVKMGDELNFKFDFSVKKNSKIRLEYAIYFLRANGSHSEKLFKITERKFEPGTSRFKKRHSFRKISTRTYYPGMQYISFYINGKEFAKRKFELV